MKDLLDRLSRDYDLFRKSNGGVTFSGGEPLLQADSLAALMESLKKEDINIALETSLFAPSKSLRTVLPFVDRYIIDLKLQPLMYLNSCTYTRVIQSRISIIQDKEKLFRIVFINGMEQQHEKLTSILKELCISHVELLKCHNLAEKKYQKLSIPFTPHSADMENMKLLEEKLGAAGIEAELLQI